MNNIVIKTVDQLEPTAVVTLYRDAGWWHEDHSEDFIPKMISNSEVFAAAFDGDTLIGMGRALSDGISDAYIQDVVVLTSWRGRKVGSRIIKHLISELKNRGVDWIGLIGEPGTRPFYENLGFKLMREYVPMKLKITD
ncbi:GNAT family N-acetyltransferase [Lentisphaerota bacterium ZTH]|nr:GNAT family N-acetyltransferase [Lentisphaerota bacterium]WET06123.1 GNAT family N-acetyltransferase [Lentisphaerota bacterium ZTH]